MKYTSDTLPMKILNENMYYQYKYFVDFRNKNLCDVGPITNGNIGYSIKYSTEGGLWP